MKILILSDSFPSHGSTSAGTIAFNLGVAMVKEGHEVFAITTIQTKEERGVQQVGGIEVHSIFSKYHERWRGYSSLRNQQTVGKVKEIIEEIKPNIVHAHNIHYHLSYYSLKLAKDSGAKVFLTAHDVMLFNYGKLMDKIDTIGVFVGKTPSYRISAWSQIKNFRLRYNPFRNIIIRGYLKYVDKIFAVSDALKQALDDNGILNVEVIHNGVNPDDWKIDESKVSEFKNKYSLTNKKVILFGGRLNNAKGGEKILLAMQKIVKKEPTAILVAVGMTEQDNYARHMSRLADKLGIKENLIFIGWLTGDELKSAFWASDVVAVPSISFDSFPTVALEAMAVQKPVVGSYFGGLPEIVDDGVTGYIINPFNIKSLADKIEAVLDEPEEARRLGLSGYERLKKQFNFTEQVQETLKWYQRPNGDRKID